MNNDLKILNTKLDKILEQQELILNVLDNKIILNGGNRMPSKKEKKEKVNLEIREQLKDMFALRPHKIRLQREFNLMTQPHASRVKAYLETKDPSVFDGLKRNIR